MCACNLRIVISFAANVMLDSPAYHWHHVACIVLCAYTRQMCLRRVSRCNACISLFACRWRHSLERCLRCCNTFVHQYMASADGLGWPDEYMLAMATYVRVLNQQQWEQAATSSVIVILSSTHIIATHSRCSCMCVLAAGASLSLSLSEHRNTQSYFWFLLSLSLHQCRIRVHL